MFPAFFTQFFITRSCLGMNIMPMQPDVLWVVVGPLGDRPMFLRGPSSTIRLLQTHRRGDLGGWFQLHADPAHNSIDPSFSPWNKNAAQPAT